MFISVSMSGVRGHPGLVFEGLLKMSFQLYLVAEQVSSFDLEIF